MKTIASALLMFAVVACGDDGGNNPGDDAGTQDAATDSAPEPTCFEGTPTTHEEIMNACTPDSVTKIFKDSRPPLLNNDGSLPPLPP